MNTKEQRKKVIYRLILSIIGEALIIAEAFLSFSGISVKSISIQDKIIFGCVFILICVLGILSAAKPGKIKISDLKLKKSEKKETQETQETKETKETPAKRRGHHPDCGKFRNHTFKIKNKIFCAGCLGLAAGASFCAFFMALYVAFPNEIPPGDLVFFVLLGTALVALNFTETLLPVRKPLFHFISNILLTAGFFLVSAGIFQLTGNTISGLFGIAVSLLWLDTRIKLSEWKHSTLCENCSQNCKTY